MANFRTTLMYMSTLTYLFVLQKIPTATSVLWALIRQIHHLIVEYMLMIFVLITSGFFPSMLLIVKPKYSSKSKWGSLISWLTGTRVRLIGHVEALGTYGSESLQTSKTSDRFNIPNSIGHSGVGKVLVTNITSCSDAIFLASVLPESCQFAAEGLVEKIPFLRKRFGVRDTLVVNREKGSIRLSRRTQLTEDLKVQKDSQTSKVKMIMFTQSISSIESKKGSHPFDEVPFRQAIQAQACLVPLAIRRRPGSKGWLWFRPAATLEIEVMEPISTKNMVTGHTKWLMERVCELISEGSQNGFQGYSYEDPQLSEAELRTRHSADELGSNNHAVDRLSIRRDRSKIREVTRKSRARRTWKIPVVDHVQTELNEGGDSDKENKIRESRLSEIKKYIDPSHCGYGKTEDALTIYDNAQNI